MHLALGDALSPGSPAAYADLPDPSRPRGPLEVIRRSLSSRRARRSPGHAGQRQARLPRRHSGELARSRLTPPSSSPTLFP